MHTQKVASACGRELTIQAGDVVQGVEIACCRLLAEKQAITVNYSAMTHTTAAWGTDACQRSRARQ